MTGDQTIRDVTEQSKTLTWPYVPGESLPQVITLLFAEEEGPIDGVWWSEAMGFVGYLCSPALVTQSQLERIAEWLTHWLENEPRGFTQRGSASIQDMLAKIDACRAFHAREEHWRRQCETSGCDHLL